jgi:hypothetical protein
MKFLGFYTPEHIAQMCKEGTVKVTISVYDRKGEELIYFENGNHVLRVEDKILSELAREIRSWRDLFTIDVNDEKAMYLTDSERDSLK